jgi:hypothetical protein
VSLQELSDAVAEVILCFEDFQLSEHSKYNYFFFIFLRKSILIFRNLLQFVVIVISRSSSNHTNLFKSLKRFALLYNHFLIISF